VPAYLYNTILYFYKRDARNKRREWEDKKKKNRVCVFLFILFSSGRTYIILYLCSTDNIRYILYTRAHVYIHITIRLKRRCICVQATMVHARTQEKLRTIGTVSERERARERFVSAADRDCSYTACVPVASAANIVVVGDV